MKPSPRLAVEIVVLVVVVVVVVVVASRLRSVARSPKRSYRRYYSYSFYRHSSLSPPISSSLSLLSRVPVLDLIFSRSCAQSSLRLRRLLFFRFLVFFPRLLNPPRRCCSDISVSLGSTPARFPTSPRLLLKLCLGTKNRYISDWLVYLKKTILSVCSRQLSSLSPFSSRRF